MLDLEANGFSERYRVEDMPAVGGEVGLLAERNPKIREAACSQAVRLTEIPEFDLEDAHYGLFQGIGEVDFA
jgi:hypothetical protein